MRKKFTWDNLCDKHNVIGPTDSFSIMNYIFYRSGRIYTNPPGCNRPWVIEEKKSPKQMDEFIKKLEENK